MKYTTVVLIVVVLIVSLGTKFYFINASDVKGFYQVENISKNGDASHYIQIAENICKNFAYSDTSAEVSEFATWRPPFWPFLLALYMSFSSSYFGLAFVKIVVETIFITLMLYYFKRKEKWNFFFFFLALMTLFEPQYLKYSVTFLSESITAILILLTSLIFYRSIRMESMNILFPILCAITILSHPVAVFFVALLLLYYLLFFFRTSLRFTLIHASLFLVVFCSWPLRNMLIFNQGFYITASQGATFSKGWNEEVLKNFTNVDGDLADESLNLKYIQNPNSNMGVIQRSKLYQEATWEFINQSDCLTILKIAVKKIKSNFTPFPEKKKNGSIEFLGTVVRFAYLFLLVQSIYIIFKNGYKSKKSIVPLIVLFVYLGQIILAVYIYTGIRFNAIYGLVLLFSFLFINTEYISKKEYLKLFLNKIILN